MNLADILIRQIESLGYKVECRTVGDLFVTIAVGEDEYQCDYR